MQKKITLISFLIIGVAVLIGYNYIYKDHRDISEEIATHKIEAVNFSSEFAGNPEEAERKYLNKIIEITGIVSEISSSEITLNNGVFCSFLETQNITNLSPGKQITIKGRCIGYDDLLEEIKLDQCTILKTN